MEEEKLASGRVMIDDVYYIRLEDRNYILCESKKTKSGKNVGEEVESVVGYFTSIEGAFNRYMKELIVTRSAGKTMDVREFVVVMKQIREDIKKIQEVFML